MTFTGPYCCKCATLHANGKDRLCWHCREPILAQARRDVEAAERKALDLFETWAQFSESQEPRIEWAEAREVLEIIIKARARLAELEGVDPNA